MGVACLQIQVLRFTPQQATNDQRGRIFLAQFFFKLNVTPLPLYTREGH
jgi:hypothetical protein